ncbi:MAG: hypothetical protein DMD84_26480 [Candidatus Rokuibacteriota bacterium]|nr:MAG: hypothetical protein DMD84_26480 [Candidatus Rokubacteria bacterium]
MAKHVRAAGKQLRPHAKTHRCPEIAHKQVAAGAVGVACAKLGEAEVMARFGIRGLLITTEVVSSSAIRRLMRLVAEAPDTMVVVDNAENVDALARAAVEDRKLAIVGDEGIHTRVGDDYWTGVRDRMIERLRAGAVRGAVIGAVAEVGTTLARFFPRGPDDVDELPDDISLGR